MTFISLSEAAERLRRDGIVIVPTETFYGIASRALSPAGARHVFCAKRRPADKPLPVIVGHRDQLDMLTAARGFDGLIDVFWPGPLSVLLPARPCVPSAVTGGTGKVAVRLSPHPAVRNLALRLDEPITASSANLSGGNPVTGADELDEALVRAVDGIVALPPKPAGGAPSTLVEPLGPSTLRVLRRGAVGDDVLRAAGFVLTD